MHIYRLFLAQLVESEGEVEKLSKTFLKNRTHWELYVPYILNRQYSESTLNSYEMIRKFFDVMDILNNNNKFIIFCNH